MISRIEPDRVAMEIIHRKLQFITPLDEMLKVPVLKAVIVAIARDHMRRKMQFDIKAAQAKNND